MGTLILPNSGSVYLDANGFIYSVEHIEPYSTLLKPLWLAAQQDQLEVISSELVLLETLTKPLRAEDTVLEKVFRTLLLQTREVRLIPTTLRIWEQAAQLRAKTGLKTPDALHAATALSTGCHLFLTNDDDFKKVPGLPVTILHDLIELP